MFFYTNIPMIIQQHLSFWKVRLESAINKTKETRSPLFKKKRLKFQLLTTIRKTKPPTSKSKSLRNSRINGRFSANIQFWTAIFQDKQLYFSDLTTKITFSSSFQLEKEAFLTLFWAKQRSRERPNVKILLNKFCLAFLPIKKR